MATNELLADVTRVIVEALVDEPEGAEVIQTVSEGGQTYVVTVRTVAGDMGKVIGKSGRNAQALRTLLEAIASKNRQRVVVEMSEDSTNGNINPYRKRRRDEIGTV